MPELRDYVSTTRQLIDFNNVIDGLDDYGVYCIPIGLMSAIRVLLGERGLWRTSYVIEHTNNGYFIPTLQEFKPVSQAIYDFLGRREMSCDLVSALAGIENAIRAINCSQYVNVSVWSDGVPRYGSGVGGGTSASDVESQAKGFVNLADEMTHKCRAANAIVDGLIASLNNLSILSIANMTRASIAVGLIANPPAALIGGLIALAVSFAAFQVLATAIDDNRQGLVCALYQSDDVRSAYDGFHDALSDLVVYIGAFRLNVGVIAGLLGSMVSTDVIGALYRSVGLPSVGESVSCSGCGGGYAVIYGTENITNLQSVSSVVHPNMTTQYISISFVAPGVTIGSVRVISGVINRDGFNELQVYRSAVPEYEDREFSGWSGDTFIVNVELNSDSPFTIEVDWAYA